MKETDQSVGETVTSERAADIGQKVLDSIAYAETLQGYVDPENPVYDQN